MEVLLVAQLRAAMFRQAASVVVIQATPALGLDLAIAVPDTDGAEPGRGTARMVVSRFSVFVGRFRQLRVKWDQEFRQCRALQAVLGQVPFRSA